MNWRSNLTHFLAALLIPLSVHAQKRVGISVAERATDNSPEAEMASFQLADGYEVNLFASEENGIANPIAIRWDAAGRLWVLTTLAYAQVPPGGKTNDQLLILEDTNRDGRVDKTSVWADGLNMPTGFALGHGGVYLSEGEDLVFLEDTDGDDKADSRKMLLSGFGTGDTHQNINSLSWGPAGDLWFCQGLHNFSRVETPWGIIRGEEAGFWRFRPNELKLEPFCMHSMASQNPWGIAWDRWGAMFVKSNNTEIGYVSPGIIPASHYRELMRYAAIGSTPGKSMGAEVVESTHLPGDIQKHVLIAGYFANRVTAVPLVEDGAGFKRMPVKELLVSSHTSFRPVEVKIGPDGAIYAADWFNPIIGHYQASLRHPDRDVSHGRIWRITAQDRPLVKAPDLTRATEVELAGYLDSPERWIRDQARRELIDRPGEIRIAGKNPHHTLELIWVAEGKRQIDPGMVETALQSTEPRIRAYGARMIGRWSGRLPNRLDLLAKAIADPHPRVRMEAVVAASHLDSDEAMKLALRTLEQPVDKFIDYSLSQSVHALAEAWLPALEKGELEFASPDHLAYAVRHYGGPRAAQTVLNLLDTAPEDSKRDLYLVLAKIGSPQALRTALEALPSDLDVLLALHEAHVTRQVRPAGNLAEMLRPAMENGNSEIQAAAIHLAGVWGVNAFSDKIRRLAENPDTPSVVRHRAFFAWARLEPGAAKKFLTETAGGEKSRKVRRTACEALAILDLDIAATYSAKLLSDCQSESEAAAILAPYLSRRNGSDVLAAALEELELDKHAATHLSKALSSAGRSDPKLMAHVNQALGVQTGAPDYDPEFVQKLVTEVRNAGDAANGKKIYESPLLNCVACHQIDGKGGLLGPDLTTVGAGLTTDLIIEAILWPGRQLKEGYFSVTVTTNDGRVYNGYREREEDGVLWLRDIATRETVPIQKKNIAQREDVGTLMPGGLTASLGRKDLRDLVRFLSEQRGAQKP